MKWNVRTVSGDTIGEMVLPYDSRDMYITENGFVYLKIDQSAAMHHYNNENSSSCICKLNNNRKMDTVDYDEILECGENCEQLYLEACYLPIVKDGVAQTHFTAYSCDEHKEGVSRSNV